MGWVRFATRVLIVGVVGLSAGGCDGDDSDSRYTYNFGAPGGAPGTGGMVGAGGGMVGAGGAMGDDVFVGAGGVQGIAGPVGSGGVVGDDGGGEGGVLVPGACCDDGDCLCHGPDPAGLTADSGPYNVDSYDIGVGKVFYPTDAEPPFAAIAICPGFTNTGPEMEPWGPFYASHGIVLLAVDTLGSDQPSTRATKLLAGIDALEGENAGGGPLAGKLSGRYGTSGYSMGGGGTTIASGMRPTLRTSVGLAAWGPDTSGVSVPTLLLCGTSDGTAPCSTSQRAYDGLPDATPKMKIEIAGASHFSWFNPGAAGAGTSGMYALAFQKVYLEGDQRWKSLLLQPAGGGEVQTNIH